MKPSIEIPTEMQNQTHSQPVFASNFIEQLVEAQESFEHRMKVREVGIVHTVTTGVALVSGLPGLGYEELVRFRGGGYGIALNIDEHDNGIVLLCDSSEVVNGTEVERTGRVMDIPVGTSLLGRVIDPLGNPIDERGTLAATDRLPIERASPDIMDRAPVSEPLQTGIKVIDSLVPIGRGQRQLILGDRQTGKTAIALDTIANQKGLDVICIYCTIGQRTSSVAKAIGELRQRGAMDYTVVVVTEGHDPPGLRYLAPYAATSVAEHFMELGHDVLIVYDDLTHHALAYRELSLLLRRPPGREAFPGDIFYIHSRLLERSTHLSKDLGGGSLTALPIIETKAENLSDYIPTNLISITDGQLYLSPRLFELGQLPAIDVGKSVSRVGGKAQYKVFHHVTGPLKLAYSQFEEMEVFARFGTRMDDRTRGILVRGRRIRAILQQAEFSPINLLEQIVILTALTEGYFDPIPLDQMSEAEILVKNATANLPTSLIERFASAKNLSTEDRTAILEVIDKSLAQI